MRCVHIISSLCVELHVLRDIIQNPDTFIQVIASFSLLEPERLGYDLNMKIWAPNKPPLHVWDDRLRARFQGLQI